MTKDRLGGIGAYLGGNRQKLELRQSAERSSAIHGTAEICR